MAFWTDTDKRHQFKVFKPVEEVVEDDLPPAWLKSALVVDEDGELRLLLSGCSTAGLDARLPVCGL